MSEAEPSSQPHETGIRTDECTKDWKSDVEEKMKKAHVVVAAVRSVVRQRHLENRAAQALMSRLQYTHLRTLQTRCTNLRQTRHNPLSLSLNTSAYHQTQSESPRCLLFGPRHIERPHLDHLQIILYTYNYVALSGT